MMVYKEGFDGNDYGVLLEENGVFINRNGGTYMKTPRTVPLYGYLNGEKRSIFNCYHAYTGTDKLFGTWILINGVQIDIVHDAQYVKRITPEKILGDDNDIDIVGDTYKIYLTRLTDSAKTDRYYMGVQLFKSNKLYKNCRIIFGLGINPNGIFELEKMEGCHNSAIPLEHVKRSSLYGFTNSELREIADWFK